MALFLDVSCNGIKKQYEKALKLENNNTSGGGFIDKKSEKKYKRVLKSWHDAFIKNKNNSDLVAFINDATIKTDGNITKDKRMSVLLASSQKIVQKIKTKFKNTIVIQYSSISLFDDIVSLLTSQRFVTQIKDAYKEFSKSKVDEYDISNIFILFHQIMTSYLILAGYNILTEIYQTIEIDNIQGNEFIKALDDIQKKNKAIVGDIGFVALEFLYVFKSIKSIKDEIKKIKTIKEESMKKIKKGHESADMAERQNMYYDISTEAYVVDRTHYFGNEDILTVSLIVVASVMALVASLALIRRAIYAIGTITIDIIKYIGVDVITISMNIKELKEKLENTTDEKERKRLQTIIDKQQKFVDMCLKKKDELAGDLNMSAAEAEYIIDKEDKEDEQEIENSSESPSSSNDEYDILM